MGRSRLGTHRLLFLAAGRYDATLRVSDWEAEVIFRSHFYIPQTLLFLSGGVLPCNIINPRLFSHVFIQQALEDCFWVSFSSWVQSHGCFFHIHPTPSKHSQRDTPYLTDTWKSLCSVARSHVKTAHKISQEYTSTDMGKGSKNYVYSLLTSL